MGNLRRVSAWGFLGIGGTIVRGKHILVNIRTHGSGMFRAVFTNQLFLVGRCRASKLLLRSWNWNVFFRFLEGFGLRHQCKVSLQCFWPCCAQIIHMHGVWLQAAPVEHMRIYTHVLICAMQVHVPAIDTDSVSLFTPWPHALTYSFPTRVSSTKQGAGCPSKL